MAKRLPDGNPVTPDSTIWATIIILILSGLVSMLLLNKSEKMEKKRRHRQISHAANVKCICQRSFEATFTKLDVDLGGKQLICPFCKSQFWHSLKSSDSSIFFKAGNQEFTDFVELALK
ncbi:MAG: hypothetical protein MUC28_00500 [Planctomycetes bacterium]|nr:hypothetical protein [Planctomycetota bacterium]